jgi:acetolactate synthase-1/2/3 large subunit
MVDGPLRTPFKRRVMTGGEAIVETLLSMNFHQVFGLPGAQLYPLFDALAQNAQSIRTFGARHEQTCGYMAFGAARSTGRPGVFAVVPGPGVLNAGAALATALGCCAPVMCITGQVPTAFIGKGRGHLHELPDQLAYLRSVTKWAARIERPADVPYVMAEAWRQMMSGRRGPVALEMAWDAMAAREEVAPPEHFFPFAPPLGEIAAREVEAAAELIGRAKRPMIMTGSGAQDAGGHVRHLAELLDAPVAAFRGGRGVVPEDHPLAVSSYAAFKLWPETDVLIGIGSRLEMPYMRWTGMMRLIDKPEPPPHLVRIDIDPDEMRRLVPHAGIVGDAGLATGLLVEAVRKSGIVPLPGARERIARVKGEARREIGRVQPQLAYLDVIREVLPRDGFLVPELSQAGFASYFGFEVLGERRYVSEGYQGTLGFGFPTALGVSAANNDVVVSMGGDGGFTFGVQELATAVQEKLAVVQIVFNNNAYGNVLRDQQTNFGNRTLGAALHNPDFVALAKAFGVEGHRVASPEELRPVLTRAITARTPQLIEVLVPQGSEVSPWEFIHPKPRA